MVFAQFKKILIFFLLFPSAILTMELALPDKRKADTLAQNTEPVIEVQAEETQRMLQIPYEHIPMLANMIACLGNDNEPVILPEEQFDLLTALKPYCADLAVLAQQPDQEFIISLKEQLNASSITDLERLLKAADLFDVEQLKLLVSESIASMLCTESAIALLSKEGKILSTLPDDLRFDIAQAAFANKVCYLWLSNATERKRKELDLFQFNTQHCDISPDGKKVAVGAPNWLPRIIDIDSGEVTILEYQTVMPGKDYFMQWHPHNGWIAISEEGLSVTQIWDTNSATLVKTLFNTCCYTVSWSPDGKKLASAHIEGISIWDVESETLNILPWQQALATAWNPACSDQLAILGSAQDVCLIDINSNTTLFSDINLLGRSLAMSPDGKKIAIGSPFKEMRVIDLQNKSKSLYAQIASSSLAWSAAGDILLIGSEGKIRLFFIAEKKAGAATVEFVTFTDEAGHAIAWFNDTHYVTFNKDRTKLFRASYCDPELKKQLLKSLTPEQAMVLTALFRCVKTKEPCQIAQPVLLKVISSLDPRIQMAIKKEFPNIIDWNAIATMDMQ